MFAINFNLEKEKKMFQADVNSTRINVKYKMTFDVILNDENDCETWRDCRDCFIQDVELIIFDVKDVMFTEDSEHTNIFYISGEKVSDIQELFTYCESFGNGLGYHVFPRTLTQIVETVVGLS